MYISDFRIQNKLSPGWSRLINRLIYVPGAAVILYGVWLSITI